jgi:hypothetical protein
VTKIISEAKGYKATIAKIICRLASIFGIEDYEGCVANRLGITSNA